MVLAISCAALLLSSTAGMLSMTNIQQSSETALISQMETNLRNIVVSKAALADSELGRYAGYVRNFADYIHSLYNEPSAYVPREVLPPSAKNAGIYAMQRYIASESLSYENLKQEFGLLGNVKSVWAPVMKSDRIITTVYMGTETGAMLDYDPDSELSAVEDGQESYYDFYGSAWYSQGKKRARVSFTDVYYDTYGRGAMIACSAPFYDAEGEFAGVVGMDIMISDLYRAIVELELGKGAYAFLVDGAGRIINNPDSSTQEVHTLSEEKDMTDTIAKGILAGRTEVFLSENRTYFACTPIRSTGWKFCVRIPESVILAPVRDVNRNIIYSMMLFLAAFAVIIVIVALVAHKFSEKLTTPIAALGRDVQEISSGNLDYRATVRDNDEIGDLAVSFNDMAASLKNYIKNLAAVTAEKERIGAELDIATQIQADMLPRIMPPYSNHEKFDIYASMTPAKEVGGDFYDFFLIDDNHLALVMADVSGKGVPAALFMVIAKTLIKNRAQLGGSPREILHDVNNQLCEGNEADLFVTVWLGILDLNTGKVIASNAGHEYPAIRRTDGKYELFKTKQSPAVATMEGLNFRESEFTLGHGDNLYVYTDGVPEATNIHEELYGTERMLDKLNSTIGLGASEVLNIMKKDVDDFTGEAPQFDDVTMMCLQFLGGSADEMHELVIEAKIEKLDEVLEFIDQHLEEWECTPKVVAQINIATEEIFVNIAHYAYENKEGVAKIVLKHTGNDAEITFTDSGIPYNPLEHEDPDITLSAEDREVGGLGIYIVKKSMNSVSYEYRDNHNVLKIRKNLA
ncbi:MAG: SpoIIE family protein phosphatase [Synergistaceae bacterium]|nr:SpoIIE family protein phosphatase [Synergistaceae bacterium]